MDIVVDTSAFVAVIIDEPERMRIIEHTTGNTIIGPGSIPWEVGNAFSAMFKRHRLTLEEAKKGFTIFESIPIHYTKTDFINTVTISEKTNLYAYDAYFLDCAMRNNAPLLSLDRRLLAAAIQLNIKTLEA